MAVSTQIITWLLAIFCSAAAAANVNAGFNVFSAAQVMVDRAAQSWEWGTAAEALLELYNNELSVFGTNPFPGGKVPAADPGVFALSYAKQFISPNGQVFVGDSAAGDPASLGVSAILIGQSDKRYIDASRRQADYLLNQVPKWGNGAISHRPNIAEIWADNLAMSFPFLAYLAVQQGDTVLMAQTVAQCGLQRDVLKTSHSASWRHIIGPQSQDVGLWSTGNGWAAYGMVRVLHTLQKWSGSSSMTSQAGQLKGWIKEILDGAMASGLDDGLLRNYFNDGSWFGEISGTALLSAVAYRMAVNDPGMFPQKYISWADSNRAALSKKQGGNGVFSPAVNPYNWLDRAKFTSGSPEGQAFAVYLYTAYRDCVNAGVCTAPHSPVTTISHPGIGPIDVMTILNEPITFSSMPEPTGIACGAPQSCDADGCQGAFNGLTKYAVCKAGPRQGCQCIATSTTCGAHQSCDKNGCAGAFDGLKSYAQCTGNFVGCECTATPDTCGPHQSCDKNGCAGAFDGSKPYAQCTKNFVGCECQATGNTCGQRQDCDLNGCAGAFDGLKPYAQCTKNFVGCECNATPNTCGPQQSCDKNDCAGAFDGLKPYAQCTKNFVGCECQATGNTCGQRQSCDQNGCSGAFNGLRPYAQCMGNFVGCECNATPNTCGLHQNCDKNDCAGAFNGLKPYAQCTKNFVGCECQATGNTCGEKQPCDRNDCAGAFNGLEPYPHCTRNFVGCQCLPTQSTCGQKQDCDKNGCDGALNSQGIPVCRGNFYGCPCIALQSTPPTPPNHPPPPPPPPPPSGPTDFGCVTAHC
ncbi:Six-hairpin glycosidase-like protein [Mariannaea sp. PMI_226]|nr:Six-hairpin glycosidase-like protein [Mariannaea sp. PMI_226]